MTGGWRRRLYRYSSWR